MNDDDDLLFGPFYPPLGEVMAHGDVIYPEPQGSWTLPLLDGNDFYGWYNGTADYGKDTGHTGRCIAHGPRFGHGVVDGDILLWWQKDNQTWIAVKTRTRWLYSVAKYGHLFDDADFQGKGPESERQEVLSLAEAAALTIPGTEKNEAAVTKLFRLAARGGWSASECNQYVCCAILAALRNEILLSWWQGGSIFSLRDLFEMAPFFSQHDPREEGRAFWQSFIKLTMAKETKAQPHEEKPSPR